MKYYIIAGEASGDLHGSKLMRALKSKDADADFRFYGGDKMQAEGGVLVRHFRDTAVMGFINVLLNLRKILSNIEFCKKDLKEYAPDVLILIVPVYSLSFLSTVIPSSSPSFSVSFLPIRAYTHSQSPAYPSESVE